MERNLRQVFNGRLPGQLGTELSRPPREALSWVEGPSAPSSICFLYFCSLSCTRPQSARCGGRGDGWEPKPYIPWADVKSTDQIASPFNDFFLSIHPRTHALNQISSLTHIFTESAGHKYSIFPNKSLKRTMKPLLFLSSCGSLPLLANAPSFAFVFTLPPAVVLSSFVVR